MVDLEAVGVRSYISEPDRGRRNWKKTPEARDAVYRNRRRIRGARGKRLLASTGRAAGTTVCASVLPLAGDRRLNVVGQSCFHHGLQAPLQRDPEAQALRVCHRIRGLGVTHLSQRLRTLLEQVDGLLDFRGVHRQMVGDRQAEIRKGHVQQRTSLECGCLRSSSSITRSYSRRATLYLPLRASASAEIEVRLELRGVGRDGRADGLDRLVVLVQAEVAPSNQALRHRIELGTVAQRVPQRAPVVRLCCASITCGIQDVCETLSPPWTGLIPADGFLVRRTRVGQMFRSKALERPPFEIVDPVCRLDLQRPVAICDGGSVLSRCHRAWARIAIAHAYPGECE